MINRLAVSGSIASIDKVKDEINVLGDDLTVWSASQLPQGFYLSTSTAAVIGKQHDTNLSPVITGGGNCPKRLF